jgi:hypothetical protein
MSYYMNKKSGIKFRLKVIFFFKTPGFSCCILSNQPFIDNIEAN